MEGIRRTVGIAVIASVLASASACGRSPGAERAELCGDLRSMRTTVAELAAPAADTVVGTIRENLQKSDVVVDQLDASGRLPWPVRDPLWLAQVDYVDRLSGIGDDETVTSAGLRIRGVAGRLAVAYDRTSRSLHCGD